ncbi:MAG: hypothetical protein ABI910_10475 [Gemmatimonadota bacterium]
MPEPRSAAVTDQERIMSPATTLARAARTAGGTFAVILSSTHAVMAQESAPRTGAWEARVSSGAFVGAGDQRHAVKDAQLTSLQVSRILRPRLALTGTFAWARSRDLASVDAPKLDVFTSDLGVELRSAEHFVDRRLSLSTFAGVGGGARSYNHRSLDVPATHNLAGYASIGGEVGMRRVALRLEARDYATGFKPLVGRGRSAVRNDVVLMGALRINRHRAARQDR